MAYDPLEPFRRQLPEGEQSSLKRGEIIEHEALRLAINALRQMPDFRLAGEHASTYDLLPLLEAAYSSAERELEKEDRYWNEYFEQRSVPDKGIEPEGR